MDIQKQPGSNGRGNVKRMMTISVVVIFTACCAILFYFGVERYQGLGEGWSKFMSVLQSIIIGFGLAFLMNPIMEFFERHMYPFLQNTARRKKMPKDHAYAHIFDRTGHCGWYYCIVLCCDHTAVIPDHPLSGHTHQRTDRWCLGLGKPDYRRAL